MIRFNSTRLLSLLYVVSTLTVVQADEATKVSAADNSASLMSINIDGMQDLPITGLKMIKTGDKTMFLSANGRFAFYGGKMLDVWTHQEINELSDIDRIANRIDLAKMKLNIDELGPVTVGTGKSSVLIFIDPRCPYCGKVMNELQALQDQYTFKLVMIPLLGQASQNIVVQLGCQLSGKDQHAQTVVRDRLLKQDYAGLPTENPSACNKESLQKAVVTAKLFGLPGVPFLIAPDGRTHSGAPDNLNDWLQNKPTLAQTKSEPKPDSNAPANPPSQTAPQPSLPALVTHKEQK